MCIYYSLVSGYSSSGYIQFLFYSCRVNTTTQIQLPAAVLRYLLLHFKHISFENNEKLNFFYREKEHSHVYQQSIGIKCPNKCITYGEFCWLFIIWFFLRIHDLHYLSSMAEQDELCHLWFIIVRCHYIVNMMISWG